MVYMVRSRFEAAGRVYEVVRVFAGDVWEDVGVYKIGPLPVLGAGDGGGVVGLGVCSRKRTVEGV